MRSTKENCRKSLTNVTMAEKGIETNELEVVEEWYDDPVVVAIGLGAGALVLGYLVYWLFKTENGVTISAPVDSVTPTSLTVNQISDLLAGP